MITFPRKETGFTLIELMAVVVIIAILATIAIPSYRQYIQLNHEQRVKSLLQNYAIQMEQWRAKTLTYAGFTPRSLRADTIKNPDGTITTINNDFESDNVTINYPAESKGDNVIYSITINAVSNESPTTFSSINTSTIANRWVILATPTNTHFSLPAIGITSTGIKCQSINAAITVMDVWQNSCGTGATKW